MGRIGEGKTREGEGEGKGKGKRKGKRREGKGKGKGKGKRKGEPGGRLLDYGQLSLHCSYNIVIYCSGGDYVFTGRVSIS